MSEAIFLNVTHKIALFLIYKQINSPYTQISYCVGSIWEGPTKILAEKKYQMAINRLRSRRLDNLETFFFLKPGCGWQGNKYGGQIKVFECLITVSIIGLTQLYPLGMA